MSDRKMPPICGLHGPLGDVCVLPPDHAHFHANFKATWSRTDDTVTGDHPWWCPTHQSCHGLWLPQPVCS